VLFATLRLAARQSVLILAQYSAGALVGGIVCCCGCRGEYLSVPASVGFIALLGIAVLNGLVLVAYFNGSCAPKAWTLRAVTYEGSAPSVGCARC
jgi:cobalt-zinc-cadmium resistance protein CzcA